MTTQTSYGIIEGATEDFKEFMQFNTSLRLVNPIDGSIHTTTEPGHGQKQLVRQRYYITTIDQITTDSQIKRTISLKPAIDNIAHS